MRIKQITIKNFRCYYGENKFDISDGLTLIIGDNADGKTTFFEALEWLFRGQTEDRKESHISEMRKQELTVGESDEVVVSMMFEHDGPKELVKRFNFTKNNNDKIDISDYSYLGYEEDGVDRLSTKGSALLERCFDTIIRRYSLFKGESQLDVFSDAGAMKMLVDTFSEVRQFDSLSVMAEDFHRRSEDVVDKERKKDKKNEKKINDLNVDIATVNRELDPIQKEIRKLTKSITDYTQLLEALEKNRETMEEYERLTSRIDKLEKTIRDLSQKTKINFNTNLLDEYWILMAFPSILDEYQNKISKVEKDRRRIEKEEQEKQAKLQVIEEIQNTVNGITPLPWNLPDEKTMQEMIDDECCKVCGRPAPKGSEAYTFMVKKLNTYLEMAKKKAEEKKESVKPSTFANEYINELNHRRIQFSGYETQSLSGIHRLVSEKIRQVNALKHGISIEQGKLDEANEDRDRLVIEANGLSKEALESGLSDLMGYVQQKSSAEIRLAKLQEEEKQLLSLREQYKAEKAGIAPVTGSGKTYAKISLIFKSICEAIKNAKKHNLDDFVHNLETAANRYMQRLNENDFHGVIRIVTMSDNSARIKLQSSNGTFISNPNEAQKTTMYMSVLFAVSEITSLKRDQSYPLIFDAPTSSFGDYKEGVFYNIIDKIDNQCIIVTKDLLTTDPKTKEKYLNMSTINKLSCSVYRIEKEAGYNPTDLSTVRTTVKPIK